MNRSPTAKIALLGLIIFGSVSCNDEKQASLTDRLDQVNAGQSANQKNRPAPGRTKGPSQLGNIAELCDGNNQIWGLTDSSKTAWYAVKKKVLPVEGKVGNEGYIVTDVDGSYNNIGLELLFDIGKLNSQNPLRDTRIRKFFFGDVETTTFQLQSIGKEKSGNDLPIVGDTDKVEFRGTVEIAGATLNVTVPAYVTRTIDSLHVVNSDKPTTIDVSKDSAVVQGVQSLLEVANLASGDMEDLVSIKFDYTFKQTCPN